MIGRAEASVQLPALFPSIPYGEVLPLAENSLLQEVHSQLPNGFPGNRGDERWTQELEMQCSFGVEAGLMLTDTGYCMSCMLIHRSYSAC